MYFSTSVFKEDIIHLRNCVRNLKLERIQPLNEIEKAILIANSAYKQGKSSKITNKISDKNELSKYLSFFIGDENIKDWPYLNSRFISDEDAIKSLRLLAKAPLPNESIRGFIDIFFNSRKRETWIPAAEALASLSLHDETSKKKITKFMARIFSERHKSKLVYS